MDEESLRNASKIKSQLFSLHLLLKRHTLNPILPEIPILNLIDNEVFI